MEIKDYLHLYFGCEYEHEDDFLVVTKRIVDWRTLQFWNENCKLILRPLSDMTDGEVNNIVSILLGKETTCGKIERTPERDFISAVFKTDRPHGDTYKSMSMGIWINSEFRVDYRWEYYTEENCEGSCGTTTETLHNQHQITRYLLIQHFDIFGLIDAGLAIDKTKMVQLK